MHRKDNVISGNENKYLYIICPRATPVWSFTVRSSEYSIGSRERANVDSAKRRAVHANVDSGFFLNLSVQLGIIN